MTDLVPSTGTRIEGELWRVVAGGRHVPYFVVADEHLRCRVVDMLLWGRSEVLLLAASVALQHHRLGRQLDPVLDPESGLASPDNCTGR